MFWKKWFKKKRPAGSLTFGVKITECKKCDKFNKGTELYNLFDWQYKGVMGYDKEAEEILLAKEQLMRIIQMVNPAQLPRKIRLVSQEEIWKR